jgi:hypothetical protein
MNKNRFAGLADARMKALDEKPTSEGEEQPIKQARKEARKQGSKKTRKLVKKKESEDVNMVGVTILVPEEKRIWWNVQAKLQKTSLKDAIIEALDKRFGEPKF